MSRIYLYLAARNRRGIRVLATLQGPPLAATRISDLNDLGLSAQQIAEVKASVESNRMDWELWAESAKDSKELAANLKARGYQRVAPARPELSFGNYRVSCNHRMPDCTKTMIRKGQS